MIATKANIKINKIIVLLDSWLKKRTSIEAWGWLEDKKKDIMHNSAERILFTSFSSASRYLGKQKLNLSTIELNEANQLITGWQPVNWTVDQVGRTILILSFPHEDRDKYVATLGKIFAAADVGEAIALYQSLSLLPHPEQFRLRAAEGIRTNMTSVFNAVAWYNPYPAKYLDELAWNQMVLKALFVGSALDPIYGLKDRNNRQLCQMLIDYARERLAAKRTVSEELWELVLPFAPEIANDLKLEFNTI